MDGDEVGSGVVDVGEIGVGGDCEEGGGGERID